MNPTAERILAELGAGADAPAAEELRAALADGLPSIHDENWKYASLRALERAAFRSAAPPSAATLEQARTLLPPRLAGHRRIVLVDGHLAPSLGDADGAIDTSPRLPPASAAWGARAADARFAIINAAFSPAPVAIVVPRGARQTLELCAVTTQAATQAAAHPRLRIDVAAQAELTLVERHLSSTDADALTNLLVEARVDTGARLHVVRSQQHGPRSQFFESLCFQIGRDAQLDLVQLTLGALSARTTARVDLLEPGAQCELRAALLADASRVHDAFFRVEHHAPHTRTREVVRGIAADRARIGFNGHIIMAAGATGAESEQSLRGLLSGAECEVDLRPQLEIYVDAVKASHGATTGKLDENMLFYLLSRGIDRRTAQSLLKWAFIGDVMTHLADRDLRVQLERDVAARMADVPMARELA